MSKFLSVFILLFAFVVTSANLYAQSGKLIKTEKKPAAKTGKNYTVAKKATVEDAKKVSPSKNGTSSSVKSGNNYSLPADFPKYIDTGNPTADRENYRKAKDEWVMKNPKRYEEIKKSNARVRVISKDDYNKLPEDRKKVILDNPSKYQVK